MRWAVVALAVVGCRIDLDNRTKVARQTCQINTVSTLCTGADALTDCTAPNKCFTYIKDKIFDANCKSDSCHNLSGTGKLDLSTDVKTVSQDTAYANLVGADGMGSVFSMVDTSRRLVVPGVPDQSYLEMMMQKIAPEDMDPPANPPPSNVQYMPQANGVLCCQKLDLIDRWITDGALNN